MSPPAWASASLPHLDRSPPGGGPSPGPTSPGSRPSARRARSPLARRGFRPEQLAHVPVVTTRGAVTVKRADVMAQLHAAASARGALRHPSLHALPALAGSGDYPHAEYAAAISHPPAVSHHDRRRCRARGRAAHCPAPTTPKP